MKNSGKQNEIKAVCKQIEEHMKNPEYVKALEDFIRLSTS